ncbi:MULTISPECIES: flagellar hook-associated protein FlgK [unclassified Rhizobium]|jgi:flagellar hook-associated protein 1 FlgK|uniref:flagellar hook-associated protein FlgK n=1 Tax=unclassified Rhizobium TaxID=2613769 RepID=UPI000DD85F77|nr:MULTISPECIES: flagellar hook-associated protein FlgK [unclassified Rhizobium]MBB3442988.1 flagellar hook-associated protein 1 FlgK [Rhizobium sp. BK379]MBB3562958.1 flagellar hook-associated protein 1 FlgK [Rhizobium sp. BK512]
MSLTSALNTAQSIFNNTGAQSSIVSNNISNAGNKDYVRRQAMLTTSLNGAQVVKISRAQEDALLKQYLKASSQDSAQQTLLSGLEDLKSIMGGNDNETSPETALRTFRDKLGTFRATPGDLIAAQGAITAAQDVVTSLNNASKAVQQQRSDADKQIKNQVDSLNSLLKQFETANNAVKKATSSNEDPSSALDEREKVLKQINQIVGVSTATRANNDMVLYTADGTTLFETIPRAVSFEPTQSYAADTVGNKVYVDGVAVNMGSGSTTNAKGSLASLLQIRDDIAPTFQSQLDEVARGLVNLYQEDGNPGLFVWTNPTTGTAGGVPPAGTVIKGIAGTIAINDRVVTSKGGDPMRLRDGNINASSTAANPTGSSGYTAELDRLYTSMDSGIAFDPSTGLDTNVSILTFATNSIGWLEQNRSNATTAAENTQAAAARTDEAYSNETGVNLDEELTLLLDIEQSYKAATKILNAVDEMLKALLDIAS